MKECLQRTVEKANNKWIYNKEKAPIYCFGKTQELKKKGDKNWNFKPLITSTEKRGNCCHC